MHSLYLAFLSLAGALFAFAQAPDPIVLPADKTEADLILPLRSELPKEAKVNLPRLLNSKGVPVSPQPVFANPVLTADKLRLHLSKIYFWGEATLQFQAVPVPLSAYKLQRGPALASPDLQLGRRSAGQLWLYNFDTQPVAVKWRIVSGEESLCGIDANGRPRRDCASPDKWSETTLGPARSDVIAFTAPDWWFNPWEIFCGDIRQAQLELLFGAEATAPSLRMPLKLHLDPRVWDGWWLPSWIGPAWSKIEAFLLVTFWVTLGAILLMMAQVMIPNFRKCLRMEGQLEGLQERLRAIGSGVGDSRLYTRSHRELEKVRVDLALGQSARSKFLSVARLALAGNTAEVNRIAAVLPRIESRIRLMEQLDELQPAALDCSSGDVPPSLCWDRARQLRKIQVILSGQVITEADEKTASAALDLLADADASMKEFGAELETRIAGLRRQLAQEPWLSKYGALIAGLNGCAELVPPPAQPAPEVSLTTDELVFRDVAAVRLAVVCQMIAIEPLLAANTVVKDGILKKLQSDDPAKLAEARNDVLKLSQGVSEQDVKAALEHCMWDAYYEPDKLTEQDVLYSSFVFRDKDINRSAAKNAFQCYWRIFGTAADGSAKDDIYESGWEAEFIPWRGVMKLSPEIYGPDGKEVTIRPSVGEGSDKGFVSYPVGTPPPQARLLRGLVDALLTAVVPVISVAITQLQTSSSSASPGIYALVGLGFTSQAIRSVVVPEPASAPQPPKPPAADTKA